MSFITLNCEPTMSTREIADLIGKQHSNIKISAERLAASGVIGTLATQEFTHNGNTYTEYRLSKRDSVILVAQNCPEFTARIVDRWQELEAQSAAGSFKVPTSLSGALRLAAEQAELIEKQQAQIEAAAPAVAFVDRFVEAKSSKCLSDVAKLLGWKPQAFIAKLADDGVIFKRGGSWVPAQGHIDAGRFTVKTGESSGHAYQQTRVTPAGVEWLAKRMQAVAVEA